MVEGKMSAAGRDNCHRCSLASDIGEAKTTVDIRNFSLRRSQVGKMGKICFNLSLMYNDLRQRTQRITVRLFIYKGVTQDVSILHPLKHRFFNINCIYTAQIFI